MKEPPGKGPNVTVTEMILDELQDIHQSDDLQYYIDEAIALAEQEPVGELHWTEL